MKKTTIFLLAMAFALLLSLPAMAQTAVQKKAAQSVFALTTFNADGSIHTSTYGVFTGKPGEGIANWNAFDGAQRAVVVDAKGRTHEVEAMLGVNELYDLCQFRVKDVSEVGLPLASTDAPENTVYLIIYNVKKPVVKKLSPLRTEKFMTSNNYYVFNDVDVSGTDLGNPIINERGELLGIMQRNKNGGQAYAADARIVNTFKVTGMSLNDRSFRATGIRTALPTTEQDATLMLMMAAQQADSANYEAYIDDFIRMFPTSTEGYRTRAGRYIAQRQLAKADQTFAEEVKRATPKDQAYNDYAQAMFRAVAFKVDTTYTRWTFDEALKLSQEAEKINPLPVYKYLQAQIIYAQGDYEKALTLYTELQNTDLAKNGDIYLEAAQCKIQMNKPKEEVISLLDKAVNAQEGSASAPYVLARGRYYDQLGENRKAFSDYLRYDTLVANRGTHDFYYLKFKNEMKLRQYQLALNDIAHAIVLNRMEPTYYAEMGSLQLQVKQLEEAVRTCDLGLQVTQEYSDLYIIKGITLCELGKKTEGLDALRKAGELGDTRAQGLIDKYSK